MVGLSNVNTSELEKDISTETQSALDKKKNTITVQALLKRDVSVNLTEDFVTLLSADPTADMTINTP